MTDYKLIITLGTRQHILKAALEYESAQIQRIRVFGKVKSILLENNYPSIKTSNGKRGIKWKIREGNLGNNDQIAGNLLTQILSELEDHIKGKKSALTHQEYLQKNKW